LLSAVSCATRGKLSFHDCTLLLSRNGRTPYLVGCVAEIVAASVKMHSQHVYEIRPRKDHRGVDLISDVLPFGRLWYGEPDAISNAVGYAKFFSRSHDAVIRVYDEAGNVIETHEHAGDFKEW
jgi:hypothetical protein